MIPNFQANGQGPLTKCSHFD